MVMPPLVFESSDPINFAIPHPPKNNEFVDIKNPFKLARISEDLSISHASKPQDQYFKYNESKRSISVI